MTLVEEALEAFEAERDPLKADLIKRMAFEIIDLREESKTTKLRILKL